MLTIKDVCERYQLSPVYVRRMILQGKIPTTRVEIGRNTFRHEMKEEDILHWRSQSQHNRRKDGRNRYILYSNHVELDKLQSLIQNDPEVSGVDIVRQNKVKKIA